MKYNFSPFTYFLIKICSYVLSVLTVMILTIGIVIAPDYPTKEWKIIVLEWVQTYRKTVKSNFWWSYWDLIINLSNQYRTRQIQYWSSTEIFCVLSFASPTKDLPISNFHKFFEKINCVLYIYITPQCKCFMTSLLVS